MTNKLFAIDLTKLKPALLIKNKDVFESLGLNMAMRIWDISPIVSTACIESKLNKILESDTSLNGILFYSYISQGRLELLCFISSKTTEIIPVSFFLHYSRVLSEIYLPNKLFGGKEFEIANKIAQYH